MSYRELLKINGTRYWTGKDGLKMEKNRKEKNENNVIECRLDIGASVRRLREERGLSGVALCRRGQKLDPKTLTALEKGRIKNPSIATLQALAKGFGMTVSDLFRQMELQQQDFFSLGSQKGLYKIDFPSRGIQLISFTPLNGDVFCGKMIIEGQKGFDEKLLDHAGAFFVMTLIGQIEGEIEGKKVMLKEGDNLFLNGGMNFRMTNALQRCSTLLLVTAPSCFQGRRSGVSVP